MGDNNDGRANIPHELLIEILLYLPVKSLIRFTCVCKSWLNLIKNDHQFAMKHYLTRATSSSNVLDNIDCIFDVTRFDKPCLYSFTANKTLRFMRKFDCVPDVKVYSFNSCHGIICFGLRLKSQILLCNPSIQEVVLLPPCPVRESGIALGFDPINKDYKVVAISFNNNLGSVYSLREGHWRNLHVSVNMKCDTFLKGRVAINANGRISNWLGYNNYHPPRDDVMVSFDMVDEVFSEVPMPECMHPKQHGHELLSTTKWQGCISCVHWNSICEVWVREERGGRTWSKQFVVKCADNNMRPLNLWLNDNELLFTDAKHRSKGEIEQVFHYDRGTHELKTTGRRGSLYRSKGGYVESLVSIKGLMSLYGGDDDLNKICKQEDEHEYIFRVVTRKGIQLSYRFNLA